MFSSLFKKSILACLLVVSVQSRAQLPWTENFGVGCNQGQLANGFISVNGTWVVTLPGANDPAANTWYISATESGMGVGVCGDGCLGAGTTNRTLHIANVPTSPLAAFVCPTGDCGAAYDAGFGANNVTANTRAESPIINCTGQSNITLAYNYIEAGTPGVDEMSVWYFNGAVWALLNTPGPSNNLPCGGQGNWTANTFLLPASANNNANVKIGFRWVNNDDAAGTDPSVAIDDITLTASAATPPTVTITPPASATVCVNQPVALTGNCTANCPVTSWNWTVLPAGGVTPPTGATQNFNTTFTLPGTYTVSLVGNNGSGPSIAVTQTITVNSLPSVSVNPPSASICSGGTGVVLTASGATTYTWIPSTGLSATSGATVTANPTANQTYTVVGIMNGCPGPPVSVAVTVSAALNPTITGSSNNFCSGTVLNLSASGGSTYLWAASGGPTPTPTPTANVQPSNPGPGNLVITYTLTANGSGCPSATATYSVTVKPKPVLTTSPTTVSICGTATAPLTVSSTLPGTIFNWTPAAGLSNPNISNPIASPVVTTTYSAIGTINGCSDTATAIVIYNSSITAIATASLYTVCPGTAVNLNGSPGSGGFTYAWTDPLGTAIPASSTVTVNPMTTTIYTLTMSGPCATAPTNSDTVKITVVGCVPPQAGFSSSPTEICGGGCILYTDTSTNIPGTWQWTFAGGSPSSSTVQNPVVCYYIAGYYDVILTVTNGAGTNTTTSVNYVHVNVSPIAQGGANQSIDIGQSVTIGGSGGVTYSWAPPEGLSCTNCPTPTASPTITTNYILTVYNAAGCSSDDTVNVEVKVLCLDAFVPTAFSPNDDGNNDELRPRGNCIKSMVFRVYDRWGEKVFETKDKEVGWNGKYNGKAMDTGVFVYSLEGFNRDGDYFKFKGNVTLIR